MYRTFRKWWKLFFFYPQRKMWCEYEYVPAEYSPQYMHAKEKDSTGWKKTEQVQSHMVLFKRLRVIMREKWSDMFWGAGQLSPPDAHSLLFTLICCCHMTKPRSVTQVKLCVYARAQHTKLYLFFRQSSVNEHAVIRGSLNVSWLQQLWFFPKPW